MRKIIFISLFLALAAQGQQLQRIAILNTEDDVEPPISISELSFLTAKLREVANNILPKNRYGVMTSESIVERLGSQEQAAKICREATCLVDLGRKVSAEFVAQARIGRFGGTLTIKAELYDVRSGNLIASFTGNSKDVHGLLGILEEKSPDLFKKMPGVGEEPPAPTPATVVSLAQMLKRSSLPSGCVEDFVSLLKREDFSMARFMRDLSLETAKVRVQLQNPFENPFGEPKDSDVTSVGLTIGCIKSLPESPYVIQDLLKDISLKAGLDFAIEAEESIYDNDYEPGERYGYQNFSGWQIVGTGFLNMLLPGVGSIVVMDDWTGAKRTWALMGGGLAIFVSGLAMGPSYYEGYIGAIGGAITCIVGYGYGVFYRPTYYDKPNFAYHKYEGFNVTVMPNRHGNFMPAIIYNKAF
jgi:hypothetical protein